MTATAVLAAALLAQAAPAAVRPAASTDWRDEVFARVAELEAEGDIRVGLRVELLDGTVLVEHRAASPFVLASNVKLFTTAAALLDPGPDHRWSTRVHRDAADGTVWVVGGGDPSLRRLPDGDAGAAFLDAAAASLRAAGAAAAPRLVVDARAFPPPYRPPLWPEDQWQAEYAAPTAALVVEGGCLELAADGRGGVVVRPELGDSAPELRRTDPDAATFAAWWTRPDRVLRLRGRPRGVLRLAVHDPVDVAARWLAHGLRSRGIEVGEVVVAADDDPLPPPDSLLLDHPSAWTLADAVHVCDKDSDNFVAETLFRTLGLLDAGVGSLEAGRAAVRARLERLGLDLATWNQVDGSGLSRRADQPVDTGSPALLCALLRAVSDPKRFPPEAGRVLFRALPIGGVDGRLATRMRGPPFQPNRVHAKTGFIHGASSLSGWLLLPDGRPAVFSIVVNYRRDGTPRTNNARFKDFRDAVLAAVLRAHPAPAPTATPTPDASARDAEEPSSR